MTREFWDNRPEGLTHPIDDLRKAIADGVTGKELFGQGYTGHQRPKGGKDETMALSDGVKEYVTCRAPAGCTNLGECYAQKVCLHQPSESIGNIFRPGWLRDDVLLAADRVKEINGTAQCKPDYHYGPVTVLGDTIRCARCEIMWRVRVVDEGRQLG